MGPQVFREKAFIVLFNILLILIMPQLIYAEDYKTIRNNMNNMTSLEWDNYTKSLKGRTVSWIGWIDDVEKQWFGGYKILIDMDHPKIEASVQDVYIEDQPLNIAQNLRKDQKVSLKGKIKSVMSILGSCAVTLEDVTISPAK